MNEEGTIWHTWAWSRPILVAGQNVFGGPNLAERNLGGPVENPWTFFEIFIPEIAVIAANFTN